MPTQSVTGSGSVQGRRSSSVDVVGLTKRFRGDVVALDGVDLRCEPGQVLALVGPSGCGKTTLLRCVAGLEQPTGGRIRIDDADVTKLDARRRGIAMVFQNYALYPNKTAVENIEFPLRMAKVPERERRERIAQVAAILRLDGMLERKPGELSGGQKQRVGIGRALVRGPSVLLMDEPLSNLDSELRVQMRGELLALQRSLGITTVYVTHDLTEAMTLGDRIAVIRSGQVAQVGPPAEVFDRPATAEVGRFLGGMNLLDGEVVGGALRLDNGVDVRLPERLLPGDTRDRRLTLGVRPEHLHLGSTAGPGLRLEGETVLVELLGAEQLVHVRIGPGGPVVRARVPAGLPSRNEVSSDLDHLHLFDATGQRLEAGTSADADGPGRGGLAEVTR